MCYAQLVARQVSKQRLLTIPTTYTNRQPHDRPITLVESLIIVVIEIPDSLQESD